MLGRRLFSCAALSLTFPLAGALVACDEVEKAADALPEFDESSPGVADGRAETVASGKESPAQVAADPDGARIWFVAREGLFSVPRAGGDAKLVASSVSPAAGSHLAIDAKNVYYTSIATVWAIDKESGQTTSLAKEEDVNDVALDGDRLFFVRGDVLATEPKGAIVSIKTDGSDRKVVFDQGLYAPVRLAFTSDGADVVYCDRAGGIVAKVPKAGGASEATVIAKDVVQPIGVAVSGTSIIWMTWEKGTDGKAPGANGVYRDGTELYKGEDWLRQLTVDATHAYFHRSGSGIWRVPLAGGNAEKFARWRMPTTASRSPAMRSSGATPAATPPTRRSRLRCVDERRRLLFVPKAGLEPART